MDPFSLSVDERVFYFFVVFWTVSYFVETERTEEIQQQFFPVFLTVLFQPFHICHKTQRVFCEFSRIFQDMMNIVLDIPESLMIHDIFF